MSTTSSPAIELVDVCKQYGSVPAVQNVDLAIAEGEFVVLLGPSGCGKSTLLKLIAGLEDLSNGEIYIGGQLANYLKPGDRDVAMVFQNYALYPHMTVRKNLAFPLHRRRKAKDFVKERIEFAADLLHLNAELDRYPDQLSGGQRQRVALGRAIVREPVAFLMDEPLSNLDALLRVQMRTELLRLHRRVGRTTIYVTHDQIEAMTMADRLVVMRDGVVQQVGHPDDVYDRPVNTYVATFVGARSMNLFEGRVITSNGVRRFEGTFSLDLSADALPGTADGEIVMGVRPEDVSVCPDGTPGQPTGIVEVGERIGSDVYLNARTPDGSTVVLSVEAADKIHEGESVCMQVNQGKLCFFGPDGVRLGTQGQDSRQPVTPLA
ncbi:MAG TPA: ABC transporter ATP-binding protein [Streptosporangiaceae bacterium]|nr:ABC transporter ATP-binding protein [Streptosporangiaceae bacterium]